MANPRDPQQIIMEEMEIDRSKILESAYWKEQCSGLTAETLIDKALELTHLSGTYGPNRQPTPFICLILRMLQIELDRDTAIAFMRNGDHKYVRVLGAFYLRLTGYDVDVYRYLEPLNHDSRKVRKILEDGNFTSTYVDEVINDLLKADYFCDIALPQIRGRYTLESLGLLEPFSSVIGWDDSEEEEDDSEEEEDDYEEEEDDSEEEEDDYEEEEDEQLPKC